MLVALFKWKQEVSLSNLSGQVKYLKFHIVVDQCLILKGIYVSPYIDWVWRISLGLHRVIPRTSTQVVLQHRSWYSTPVSLLLRPKITNYLVGVSGRREGIHGLTHEIQNYVKAFRGLFELIVPGQCHWSQLMISNPHFHSRSTDKVSDTGSEQRVSEFMHVTTGLWMHMRSKVIRRGESDGKWRCIDSLSHTYSEIMAYQVYLGTRSEVDWPCILCITTHLHEKSRWVRASRSRYLLCKQSNESIVTVSHWTVSLKGVHDQ